MSNQDIPFGHPSDAESASGDGTVIALLKRLRTLLSSTLPVSVFGKVTNPGDTPLLLSNLNASSLSSGSSAPGPAIAHALLWAHDGSSSFGRLRQQSVGIDGSSAPGAGVLWAQAALRLVNPSGTLDRAASAAASGAGLGVLKVHSQNESNLTLLASAARTSTGQGTAVTGLGAYKSATIFLDVTAAATDATDTLDVYVEYSPDAGTTWDNFVHFTQVLGNGGPKQFVAHVNLFGAAPDAMHAVGEALAAGSVRQVDFGDRLRVRWEITDGGGGGNVSFTFAVKASLKS